MKRTFVVVNDGSNAIYELVLAPGVVTKRRPVAGAEWRAIARLYEKELIVVSPADIAGLTDAGMEGR